MIQSIASTQLQISAVEKLNVLKKLDRWRPWKSLDDRRLCLGCGRVISGHEIDISTVSDEQPVEVHCPTEGCQSMPLDWILPNPRDREMQPRSAS
jgi:hypothetical protein